MVGAVDPQGGIRTDHEGPDIQGGALFVGDPVPLQFDQLRDAGQGQFLRNLRKAQTLGGLVHPGNVVQGPEQLDSAVGGAVSLQALEDLLRIVQDLGGGVNLQGAVRNDAGIVPALALVIVHNKHMVRHALAEHQGGGSGLFLQHRGAGNFDIYHWCIPPKLLLMCFLL